jgi:TolA-binding protein
VIRPLPPVIAFVLAVCAAARAQTPAAANAALAAEFPAYDGQLLSLEQRGLGNGAASHALATSPDAVETLRVLLAQNRVEDAIAVTKRILATHPERTLPALKAIADDGHRFSDQARGQREALQQIAGQARRGLEALPREDAARLEREIIRIEVRQPSAPGANAYDEALDEFLKKYDGTEAALVTSVDVLLRGRVSWQQLDALDAFARAHPRSVAGAKALFDEGWQLTVNIPITGVEPRGSDPTERFLRVVGIVKELENGSYPSCEWVDRAPELVTGFFASNPSFGPGNAERLASEYVAFARAHLKTATPDVSSSSLGYFLTTRLAALFKTQGDPLGAVERILDALAKETGNPDFTYLKATFFLRTGIDEPSQRIAVRARAREVLRTLSEAGGDLPHRKALATLACLELEDRDYADALAHFTRYALRYPSSPYAWIAALRVGESQDALGDSRSAVASYRRAASGYSSVSIAQVLGHEYAARNLEALGDFAEALTEHEAASRSWNPDYGFEYSLYSRRVPVAGAAMTFEQAAPITRDALAARIAQLRASLAHPSGVLLERGRWLLMQERRAEATDTFTLLLQRFPDSPLAAEARYLSHRAQLESALAAANVENAARDPSVALTQLAGLSREPYDEATCVAGVARATLLASEQRDEARTTMTEALTRCRTHSVRSARTTPPSALEADVVAVRNAVFLPLGGGVYGSRGWNAFRWPVSLPPFLLANPALLVKTADGAQTQMVLRDPFPGLDSVVFASGEQIQMLNSVITALGGTKRFVPASVMATPNQPAGPAVDIMAFWNQFFPARPGHWGGWEFEAYPRIASIEFLDAARTKAAVPVTVGYSGATVVLEKRDGVWRAIALVNEWIT